MEGLLEPVVTETYLGRAEVRNTFRVKGAGTIAGCYVVDGILKRDAQVRVLREGVVIYTSKLSSLKRFKDDASEVRIGFECGAGVANVNDVNVGDILECFSVTKTSAAEAAGQGSAPAGKKSSAKLSPGAAHAGRFAHPRAAHPGRAIAEGQAASSAQLEGQAATGFQCGGGRTGASRHLEEGGCRDCHDFE